MGPSNSIKLKIHEVNDPNSQRASKDEILENL